MPIVLSITYFLKNRITNNNRFTNNNSNSHKHLNPNNSNNNLPNNNKNNLKKTILHIITLYATITIMFKFYSGLFTSNLVLFIILFIASFLVTNFVLDDFKLSNKKFIRILQLILFLNLIVIFFFNFYKLYNTDIGTYINNFAP